MQKTIPVDDGPIPPHFPLHLSGNGQYRKKFRGQAHNFGSVNAGWKAALARFHHEWSHLTAGQTPPPIGEDAEALGYVATEFIAREEKRLEQQAISPGHLDQTRRSIEIAVTILGPRTAVNFLRPDRFADLRHELGFKWRKDGEGDEEGWVKLESRVGLSILRKRITSVRQMFKWAGPDDEGLLKSKPRYGDKFKAIRDTALLKTSRVNDRLRGPKRFEPTEIKGILKALKGEPQLRAMFLLTINCGFTAADCSALPWRAVKLKSECLCFPRVKNSNERSQTPLWPETVSALKEVASLKLECESTKASAVIFQERQDGLPVGEPVLLKDCVFVHPDGGPWVYKNAGSVGSVSNRDRAGDRFRDLLIGLGFHRRGIGFATGRHTFESAALRVADKSLVDSVMGHSTGEMSQRYDHSEGDDIRDLIDSVRERLLSQKARRGARVATSIDSAPRLRIAK